MVEPIAAQAVRDSVVAGAPAGVIEAKPLACPRVAVLVVTWNRVDMAENVVEAIARQQFARARLDVVVVDNASTDGTLETLARRFRPEVVVDNPTQAADRPAFRPRPVGERLGNTLGFGSLTLVRNTENLGGCGGFNTGLSYVEHALAADHGTRLMGPSTPGAAGGSMGGAAHGTAAGDRASHGPSSTRPEFVWLVDDDADLPPDALARLVDAMRTDASIGLAGSRTVDMRDRKTTIESTIYQERSTGVFGDQPDAAHPRRAEHDAWAASVGGTKGRRAFTGLRDVDIVSACSLLARWSAVQRVGFWDHRYFIYCDDADWCLRFARAGYRVVVNLDAVVFHTPWHQKLTPARLYYAQRNLLWTIRKSIEPARLRAVMRLRTRTLARNALEAGLCHRLPQAEIIRRSLDDAMRERGGKLDIESAKPVALAEVARALAGGSAAPGRPLRVAFVLNRPIALDWAAGLRKRLGEALPAGQRVEWTEFVRNSVPGVHELGTPAGVARAIYAPHVRSRVRRQGPLLKRRADLLVLFDGAGDMPLLRSPRWILHVDSARPTEGVLEVGGLGPRLAFLGRWLGTAWRARAWVRRIKPAGPTGKYGGTPTQA